MSNRWGSGLSGGWDGFRSVTGQAAWPSGRSPPPPLSARLGRPISSRAAEHVIKFAEDDFAAFARLITAPGPWLDQLVIAFTVQFMPLRPDLDGVINARAKAAGLPRMYNQTAIDMLQPGEVLVVDLFGQQEGGTIVGDNLFYHIMKTTKNGGLVVDGAIRDLEGISRMDMPAYSVRRIPAPSAT